MNPQQIKIAIVSSDVGQTKVAAETLEGKGYRVTKLTSGDQAVSQLSSHTAHVVVADQDIGGRMDGLEVLGQLRRANCQHSAILIASSASLDTAVAAMQLGVCDLLTKPIEPARLLDGVELALSRRGMYLTTPETINRIIGTRLRDIRRNSDLTTQQLADRVGVTQSQVSQIETGRSAASVVTLYRIARAIGINLSTLLEGI